MNQNCPGIDYYCNKCSYKGTDFHYCRIYIHKLYEELQEDDDFYDDEELDK